MPKNYRTVDSILVAAGGIEPPRGDYETPALPLSYAAGNAWKNNLYILP